MDFDKIVLNFPEIITLKKSKLYAVDKSRCLRLLRLGLVCELKEQKSNGCMPTGTGVCKISDKGIDYLLYRKDLNRTRFTIPIIVSVITTILLNGAIWLISNTLHTILELI